MKNAAAILFLLLGPVLVEGCSSNSCETKPGMEFTINDLFLTVYSNGLAAPHSILPAQMDFQVEISAKYLSMTSEHHGTMGAYACDVLPNHSQQKFTALKITSANDLTTNNQQTFTAGTDLSNMFLWNGFDLNVATQEKFDFTPVFQVSQKTNQTFIFSFTLDDGRTFNVESGVFELLPS